MTDELAQATDQYLCREVMKGILFDCRDSLAVGSVVRNFDVKAGGQTEHVTEAAVEQRHIAAVALLREKYPLRFRTDLADLVFECEAGE